MDLKDTTGSKFIDNAIEYAFRCHLGTCHEYDGKPYIIHLRAVVHTAVKFKKLVPKNDLDEIISACYLHDVIEDCRQTYNDVKDKTNVRVAEIVYALTNDKGKTRKERASQKYYDGIRAVPQATFVKLCDRIANVEYSKENGSRMFELYRKENAEFLEMLEPSHNYKSMVDYLNELFNTNNSATN